MARSVRAIAAGWLVVGLLAAPAGRAAEAPSPMLDEMSDEMSDEEWHPYLGMDRNGRIPAVEKAVEHPERWRYIPEGRIMPGNLLQRFLVSTFVSPIIFRDQDVGFGAGLAFIDIDFREQRRREFAGIFVSVTTEGQQSYRFTWRRWLHHLDLPEGGVLQEERSFLRLSGGYSKTLTRRFFGLGADTRASDESSYQDELFGLSFGVQRAIPDPGDDWVAEIGLRGEFHRLSDGAVSGAPSTRSAFPVLFARARDDDLGYLTAELRWDTRDSQANPYRGWLVAARADAALLQSGWDVGAVFTGSLSKAFSVWPVFHSGGDPGEENPPTDTLVFLLESSASAGNLPFFALPSLGGSDRLRGYIENRFTDRAAWYFGAEWRLWLIPRGFHVPLTRAVRVERVGVAPFLEMGSVAGRWPGLFSSKVRFSYGAGLRIALERSAIFRVDVGISNEDVNPILRFGLSF